MAADAHSYTVETLAWALLEADAVVRPAICSACNISFSFVPTAMETAWLLHMLVLVQ